VTVYSLSVSCQRSEGTAVSLFREEKEITKKRKVTDSHWFYWTWLFLMSLDVLSRTTVCQPASILTVTYVMSFLWKVSTVLHI